MRYLDILRKGERKHCGQPVALQSGCLIHWQVRNGKKCGPAVVEEVIQLEGQTWVVVQYEDADRLVSQLVITAVEPGEAGHD